jgi:hypothetical protein
MHLSRVSKFLQLASYCYITLTVIIDLYCDISYTKMFIFLKLLHVLKLRCVTVINCVLRIMSHYTNNCYKDMD